MPTFRSGPAPGPTAAGTTAEATAAVLASLFGTSTNTRAIPTSLPSTVSFSTQSGKAFNVGRMIIARSRTAATWMYGQVTAYSGSALSISVIAADGNGSYSDWDITVTGVPGVHGIALDSAAYATRTTAAAASIPNVGGVPGYVSTAGYAAPGDGGGALYKRHPGVITLSNEITGTYTATNSDGTYTGISGSGAGMRDGADNAKASAFASASAAGSSITLALSSSQSVAGIKLRQIANSLDGWDGAYLTGADIEYSTDGTSWTYVRRVGSTFEGVDTVIPLGVTARYIRVSRSNNWLALAEFRAYGSSSIAAGNPRLPRASFQSADGQWWTLVNEGQVSFASFGVVGDDSTDNIQALLDWNTWARAESEAGRAVNMLLPPGIYRYNAGGRGYRWLMGINRLRLSGRGAVFKNMYDRAVSGDSFDRELSFPAAGIYNLSEGSGKLINTVAIRSTTITLTTPADHASFQSGDWLLIGGNYTQKVGYPHNFDHFEFVQLASKDTSTGVLTIYGRTTNDYRADWPDDFTGSFTIGKARVWNLSSLSGAGNNNEGSLVPWDIDHVYEGFDASAQAPNSASTYFTITGKKLYFEDCKLPGISPSIAGYTEFKNCDITNESEPDKLVGTVLCDGCLIQSTFPIQSSSIDHIILRNCDVHAAVKVGGKHFTAENSYISDLGVLSYHYGANRTVDIRNCKVALMNNLREGIYGGFQILSPVSYSNGTITIPKSGRQIDDYWVHAGMTCYLARGGGGYTGDQGSGIVIGMRDDATNWYIDTTLHFTTLPAFSATGNWFLFHKIGQVMVTNTVGCDGARQASAAGAKGKPPSDYVEWLWAGAGANSGQLAEALVGVIERIEIDVIQSDATPSALLELDSGVGYISADNVTVAHFYLDVDLTVRGRRVFDWWALNGKTGNDAVKIDAAAQTAVPRDYFLSERRLSFAFTNVAAARYSRAIVKIGIWLDSGLFRKHITNELDATTNALVELTGDGF